MCVPIVNPFHVVEMVCQDVWNTHVLNKLNNKEKRSLSLSLSLSRGRRRRSLCEVKLCGEMCVLRVRARSVCVCVFVCVSEGTVRRRMWRGIYLLVGCVMWKISVCVCWCV
ncbi:hypothetical protein OAV88_00565 [bacterium]|nr:hypothetical protein [bacterium]